LSVQTGAAVRFGGFLFDRSAGGLFRLDEHGRAVPLPLGSRALEVLCFLVDRGGDLVPKPAIMDAVWPGTAVEENNLTVQISALRRVLDQGRRGGSCIQTVAGRGYRFLPAVARVDVALEEEGAQPGSCQPSTPTGRRLKETIAGAFSPTALLAPGGWETPHHSSPPAGFTATEPARESDRCQSMMIMPFENSGDDDAKDALAAQVTREVTNRILSAPDGAVIAGMAAEAYQAKPIDPRAIGREHDVHFVLTGNAGRHEGRLIVAAVLYECAGGGPVWGRQLDAPDDLNGLKTIAQVIYESTWQKRVDVEAWHAVHNHPDHLDKRDLILIAHCRHRCGHRQKQTIWKSYPWWIARLPWMRTIFAAGNGARGCSSNLCCWVIPLTLWPTSQGRPRRRIVRLRSTPTPSSRCGSKRQCCGCARNGPKRRQCSGV
jgi:DNA-binding winged helix-turn-helix (wHTH) protein/TolB-like protein